MINMIERILQVRETVSDQVLEKLNNDCFDETIRLAHKGERDAFAVRLKKPFTRVWLRDKSQNLIPVIITNVNISSEPSTQDDQYVISLTYVLASKYPKHYIVSVNLLAA